MGCDIHGWVEKKVGDKWIAVRELRDKGRHRNYLRFAALAGVRGDGPKPRGLPADVSETAGYDVEQWGIDGHSHSWLPLIEAAEIFRDVRHEAQDPPSEFELKYPACEYFGIDAPGPNYRLVFWFDN